MPTIFRIFEILICNIGIEPRAIDDVDCRVRSFESDSINIHVHLKQSEIMDDLIFAG